MLNYTISGIKIMNWVKMYLKGYKNNKMMQIYTLTGINYALEKFARMERINRKL